jgi:hypothetical protein
MGVNERLAAIEAKLGIEVPPDEYGFFWDREGRAPVIGKLMGDHNECDNGSRWEHFVPFTAEEVARFRAAGVCLSAED